MRLWGKRKAGGMGREGRQVAETVSIGTVSFSVPEAKMKHLIN